MIPNDRTIHLIITLILLALFLNFLPSNWLIFVPVILVWVLACAGLAIILTPLIDEFLEKYRD